MYLAVDMGGEALECAVADDVRVLARISGGELEFAHGPQPEATAQVRQLLKQVSNQAGVPLYLMTRACIGLPELASQEVRSWAEATLRDVFPGELVLTSAEEIALEAAFGQEAGIVVAAGKSSYVVSRCSNKIRFRAGGWGPVLGDEGAAHWIGAEGIRAGLRALDRGVPTSLLREVQTAWKVKGIGALVTQALVASRLDFAALLPSITLCASQGDVMARSVLTRAGEELAAQIGILLAKMRSASCAPGDMRHIAYTGTVLHSNEAVRFAMVEALRLKYPDCVMNEQATDPMLGAVARARRH